jgi:hypothetical protein
MGPSPSIRAALHVVVRRQIRQLHMLCDHAQQEELEITPQCSCCASQVCCCAKPGLDINAETQAEITEL